MDLTIAVATYEGEQLLCACLQSILLQEPQMDWELLGIDDCSTIPVARPLLPNARVIYHLENRGNIAAMDTGIREAAGEWVLFVANDVRLHNDCLRCLWAHRSYHDIVQPVLYQPDGRIDNVGLWWRWPGYGDRARGIDAPYTTDAFTATCFLIHRELYLQLGGFDLALRLSHEDVDLSLTLRQQGGACRYCPDAIATHLMGQTIGRVMQEPLSPYYHRARMRVLRKHYRGVDYAIRASLVSVLDASQKYLRKLHTSLRS